MKLLKQIILILVIFLKTGNLLSDNNLFNVNNIILEKTGNISNNQLANKAIKKAFDQLLNKVLLQKDISKISNLSFSNVRNLVMYYKISKNSEIDRNKVSFNVAFNKDKIHDLLYKNEISYSYITDKEFYILPILIRKNDIYIFSNNYFYENWDTVNKNDLIEFILPAENIEIIQNVNQSRNNLLSLKLSSLLKEHLNKNVALVLIEKNEDKKNKVFLKARIQNKIISKSLNIKNNDNNEIAEMNKIIFEVKDNLINLVKSQNLIDIRTPSFLNAKLALNKNSNLVILNTRIRNIDLIENIFVQDFNKDYVNLKIKYLGKLEKIIYQLSKEKISLKLINDQWLIKTL